MTDRPKKSHRHSHSRMDTFTHCPRRYYLDLVDPEDTKKRESAFARGGHVHRVVEYAAKRVQAGATWKDGLRQGRDAGLSGPLTHAQIKAYVGDELADVLEPWTPLEVEGWGRLQLAALQDSRKLDRAIELVGRLDLVAQHWDGYPAVLDFKTAAHPGKVPTPEEARKSIQLRLYCHMAETTSAGFIYLVPTGRAFPVVVQFTTEELQNALAWIRMTVAAIEAAWETGVWAPAAPEYPWCSAEWCAHYRKCFPKE